MAAGDFAETVRRVREARLAAFVAPAHLIDPTIAPPARSAVAALGAALCLDPLDDLTYLALADALEEAGRSCEAARYRRGKPSLTDVLHLFRAYRAYHLTWGTLHLVLEEGNLGDGDVEDAVGWACDVKDRAGERLARVLLRLSMTQRRKIAASIL